VAAALSCPTVLGRLVLAIQPIGAIMRRGRSQSGASGALTAIFVRLKTDAPGGWQLFSAGVVGGPTARRGSGCWAWLLPGVATDTVLHVLVAGAFGSSGASTTPSHSSRGSPRRPSGPENFAAGPSRHQDHRLVSTNLRPYAG